MHGSLNVKYIYVFVWIVLIDL